MMRRKKVLALSAGYYNCRVFPQMKQLGYQVIATDRDPDAPGFRTVDDIEVVDIADKKRILEVAQRHQVDGIMAINDVGVPTAAFVSEALGLPGVSVEAAKAATDKGVMRDCWRQAGLAIPHYQIVHSLEEALAAADLLSFPLVVKPTGSSGGRGVSVVQSDDQMKWAYSFALSFARQDNIIVEQFLDGTEMTIEALSYGGRTQILAMSDKHKPRLRYRVATSLNYPALFPEGISKQVADLVVQANEALDIRTGASHTEVIVTADGPRLVEMAARPGGGHIFSDIVRESSGINMVRELTRILVDEEPDLRIRSRRGCVYRFFTPPPGIVRSISGVEKAKTLPGVVDVGVTRKPGDRIGELVNSLERSGYAVVAGKDRAEAIARADVVERTIAFEVEPLPPGRSGD